MTSSAQRIREGFRRLAVFASTIITVLFGIFTVFFDPFNFFTENATDYFILLLFGLVVWLVPYGLVRAIGWVVEGFGSTSAE